MNDPHYTPEALAAIRDGVPPAPPAPAGMQLDLGPLVVLDAAGAVTDALAREVGAGLEASALSRCVMNAIYAAGYVIARPVTS